MLAQRWGTRATLRGGAGTPREKAELLLEMYQSAGIEARLMRGKADPQRLTGQQVLLRDLQLEFAPPISEPELDAWRRAWGQLTPQPRPLIDESAEDRRVVRTLLEYLHRPRAPFGYFTLRSFIGGSQVAGSQR